MNKRLIICSGDSYTAGDELAGKLLVPDYNSTIFMLNDSFLNNKKREKFRGYLQEKENNLRENEYQKYLDYVDEGKKRAWPEHLKKHIDADIINCAKGGISNEEIVHRALWTYKQNTSYSDVTVILMISSSHRFGFPRYDSWGGNENFVSFNASQSRDRNKIRPNDLQSTYDYYIQTMTDWDNIWRSYSQIIACKMYFESIGIKVLLIDSTLWTCDLERADRKYKIQIDNIRKILKLDAQLKNYNHRALAGGHFVENDHIIFAEHIAKLLNN